MKFRQDLISVVIPAYNQPHYLRRALQSVLEQDYRPIEVIVSDDCSPTVLKPIVDEFASALSDSFKIKYFRSATNRGFVDNFKFAIEQTEGRYLVPLPHDNRFLERRFFSEALRVMTDDPDCHLCYANASFERGDREALNIPASIAFDGEWAVIEGNEFIRLYRRGGMDWSQAMVLDNAKALTLGAYDLPYVVNGVIAKKFGIAQDDAFSYVFLLSAVGRVGLCRTAVCEIGMPLESYSRSASWRDTKAKVKFFIFYNIWRSDLKGKYATDVRQMAFKQALQYTDRILDIRMGRHYRWQPMFLLMAGFGVLKWAWGTVRMSYKLAVNTIRPGTFKKTNK